MKSFTHYSARSLKEAVALLAEYNGKAKVNAGGTDLLGLLRDGCDPNFPEALIDLKSIKNLSYIKTGARGLRIGALTTLADLVKDASVKKDYPLLWEAAHSVASPNLRNMATVGGNLAQEVRCWYYRYSQQIGGPIVCLRKGGKTCNAFAGDNRYHSIFGAAPITEQPAEIDGGRRRLTFGCVAAGPSDLAVALTALDATVATDRRVVEAQAFFTASTTRSTILEKDELIKEIRIPKPLKGARQTFLKFTLRKPIDFALVSVASLIASKKGICSDARIVLGGVAPSPLRAGAAEASIKGKPLDESGAVEAANLAVADALPLSMNAYKIEIAKTLVKRSILGES
jgi:xanthine dehydrogenase YagS FAD-binding subunit